MSADPEFDEEMLALVTRRALELGFDSPEAYVRHLLESSVPRPGDAEHHAKLRSIFEQGAKDNSSN